VKLSPILGLCLRHLEVWGSTAVLAGTYSGGHCVLLCAVGLAVC
jgi:hypothetical protein